MHSSSPPKDVLYAVIAVQLGVVSLADAIRASESLPAEVALRDALLARGCLNAEQDQLIARLSDAYLSPEGGDTSKTDSLLMETPAGKILLQLSASGSNEATVWFDGTSKTTPQHHRPSDGGADLWAGEVNRFVKEKVHAAGGLGEVLIARDLQLPREVALKQLQEKFADDLTKRKRFVLEGEVTGALEHPGIVPVYALGADAQGRPFYAMRFVKGETLRRAITNWHSREANRTTRWRDSLEFRRLLGRFVTVCQAIEYAHSRGVVHRDIKPANIMLGKYGETYVVDWGMALLVGRPVEDAESRPDDGSFAIQLIQGSSDTQQGSILGTPAYMSPEQASGDPGQVGPLSDVYSLGATLYYLLTAQAPFSVEGVNPLSHIRRVIAGEFTPPRVVTAAIPRELEAICLRAMATCPPDRYPSPVELAADLERWLADEPVAAAPPRLLERMARFSRKHRNWFVAGGLALTTVAAVSVIAGVMINEARQREAELAVKNIRLAEEERQARLSSEERFRRARETVDTWLTGYTEALQRVPAPGVQAVRTRMLELAAKEYEEFVVEAKDDLNLQLERALTLARLGSIYRLLGRPEDALERLTSANNALRQLQSAPSPVAGADQARSDAAGLTGQVYADLGDLQRSDEAFEDAINSDQLRLKAREGDQTILLSLLKLWINRGGVLAQTGDFSKAATAFEEAEGIGDQLVKASPANLDYRKFDAIARIGAGQVRLAQGDANGSLAAFEHAVRTLRAAHELNVANDDCRQLLITADLHLAAAQRRLGDAEGEQKAYVEAIAIGQELAASQPEVPAHRFGLGLTNTDLGQLQLDQFDPESAEESLRAGVTTLVALAREYPAVREYQTSLAAALDNIAFALLARGRFDEALACASEAQRELGATAALAAEIPQLAERAASIDATMAQTHFLRGDANLATEKFASALRWLSLLNEVELNSPHRQQLLALVNARAGDCNLTTNPNAAAKHYRRAEEAWRRALQLSQDPEFAAGAAWFFAACRQPSLRNPDDALQLAAAALAASPKNPRYLLALATAQAVAGKNAELKETLNGPNFANSSIAPLKGFLHAFADSDAALTSKATEWQTSDDWLASTLPGHWDLLTLKALSKLPGQNGDSVSTDEQDVKAD